MPQIGGQGASQRITRCQRLGFSSMQPPMSDRIPAATAAAKTNTNTGLRKSDADA
jgi:hypothetical protein